MSGSPDASGPVVVVGAGAAGLAAAQRLRAAGVRVVVLEQDPAPGGRMRSVEVDGVVAEMGAGFLSGLHPRTRALLERPGLELVPVRRSAAVVLPGEVVPVTGWGGARVAGRLGGLGVARLAMHALRTAACWPRCDPIRPVRALAVEPGSVRRYCERALGEPAERLLVEPALRGFLYSDTDRLAAAMLFVMTRAAVQLGPVLVPTGGFGAAVRGVAADLDVRLGCRAVRLTRLPAGWTVDCEDAGGRWGLACRAVVLAVTADEAARLLPPGHEHVHRFLASVRYAGASTVAVRAPKRLPASPAALLVSPRTHPHLVLATSAAARSPRLAPASGDLLTLYRTPASLPLHVPSLLGALPDGYQVDPVGEPVVTHWQRAVPEFSAEHLSALATLDVAGPAADGLLLAGDYLRSPLLEGAVVSGEDAADAIVRRDRLVAG